MARIFINYRREDSEDFSGRLYGELEKHFGRDHIFMDIDNIPPGARIEDFIRKTLVQVDVVIVIIGKQWLSIEDGYKQRRIDKPDDFVQKEIALAIELKKIIIPVLVKDTKMPEHGQLPKSIKQLPEYKAIRIWHEDFRNVTKKLIKELETQIGNKGNSGKLITFGGSIIVLIFSIMFFHSDTDTGEKLKKDAKKDITIPKEDRDRDRDTEKSDPKISDTKNVDYALNVGDRVLAIWRKNNCFYPATVLKTGTEYFLVQYENIGKETNLGKNELFLMNSSSEFSQNSEVFIYLDNANYELWVPGVITEIKSSKKPQYRVEPFNTQCNTYWDKSHQYVTREKLILKESIGSQQ